MSKTKKWIWNFVRASITLVCLYFLFTQFQNQRLDFKEISLPGAFIPVLILQLFLMVLNWFLEVYRWQLSVESVQKITFQQAAIDVLGGLSMNWVVPFTLGDFVTRIVSKADKYKTTSAIILNRLIMLCLTFLVGVFGIFSLFDLGIELYMIALGVVLLSISLLLFTNLVPLKFRSYFKEINAGTIWKIILVSTFRYFVFFLQFLILIKIFNTDLGLFEISAGIGWIFFIRSSIPSLIGGLGLRETSAFIYFQNLVVGIGSIIFPVFLLWVLNTAIPSVVGSILLWKLRAFNSADSHNIA